MKISGPLLAQLTALVEQGKKVTPPFEWYKGRDPRIRHIDKTQDIGRRYRWDVLWNSTAGGYNKWVNAAYETGLNDDHIETALRKLMPETV